MADTKISALTAYSTPQAGDFVPIVDVSTSTTKAITYANFRGGTTNASVASQSGFSTDTYLVGSSILVPVPTVTSTYYCVFDVTKTAAGTATPIFNIRFGTLGATGDTAIATLTFAAGTAAIDTGVVEIWGNLRSVGSGTAAVMTARGRITHHLAATGITSTGASGTAIILATGSGFNSTTASSIIGLSVNGGTSAAWTVQSVQSAFRF